MSGNTIIFLCVLAAVAIVIVATHFRRRWLRNLAERIETDRLNDTELDRIAKDIKRK